MSTGHWRIILLPLEGTLGSWYPAARVTSPSRNLVDHSLMTSTADGSAGFPVGARVDMGSTDGRDGVGCDGAAAGWRTLLPHPDIPSTSKPVTIMCRPT